MAQAAVFFHSEIVGVQRFWCFFVLRLLLAVSGGEEIVLIRDAEWLGQDRAVSLRGDPLYRSGGGRVTPTFISSISLQGYLGAKFD